MCQDHKGNCYKTIQDMCEAYGVLPTTFCKRRDRRWTLKECLCGREPKSIIVDGETYHTNKEFCDAYGVNPQIFYKKIKQHYSIEDIAHHRIHRVYDHLGNGYATTDEMCTAYHVSKNTYRARMRAGLTKEQALSKPSTRVKVGAVSEEKEEKNDLR